MAQAQKPPVACIRACTMLSDNLQQGTVEVRQIRNGADVLIGCLSGQLDVNLH